MRVNEGGTERVLRVVLGLILLAVGLFGGVGGVGAAVADVVGGVLLLTGPVGFCPLYRLFGVSTGGSDQRQEKGR